jgi:hypothetical protein
MIRTPLLAALAATLAAPALAGGTAEPEQPPVVVPPEPPAAEDWTGFYTGAQLEYGTGEFGTTDLDGANIGLFTGFRRDFGDIVLGVEFDWMAGGLSASGGGADVDEIARASVELGYDLGDALVYGTAGIFAMTVSPAPTFDDDDIGFVGGVGLDYRLRGNTFLSAELLHHEIDDFSGSGNSVSATTVGVGLGLQF